MSLFCTVDTRKSLTVGFLNKVVSATRVMVMSAKYNFGYNMRNSHVITDIVFCGYFLKILIMSRKFKLR